MKELLIIRHARSQHNRNLTEDLDSDITEYGLKTCVDTAQFLRHNFPLYGFQFFTSPFLRCLRTANLIFPGQAFNVVTELREYLNHSGRGVQIPPRKEEFPNFNWNMYNYPLNYEVEENKEFLNRMYSAYNLLSDKSVVITHGMPALTLIKIATENIDSVPVWNYSLDNVSLTYIKGRIIWYGRNLHHEMDKE